jgi:hypothetical protein
MSTKETVCYAYNPQRPAKDDEDKTDWYWDNANQIFSRIMEEIEGGNLYRERVKFSKRQLNHLISLLKKDDLVFSLVRSGCSHRCDKKKSCYKKTGDCGFCNASDSYEEYVCGNRCSCERVCSHEHTKSKCGYGLLYLKVPPFV